MMKAAVVVLAVLAVFVGAVPALADWDVGDPHKMHFPQLPKVDGGWDVMSSYYLFLADDWKCSQTGYVHDIHTWVSFRQDQVFDPAKVHLAIWSDDPVGNSGVPGEDPANNFSKPLQQLWHYDTTQWTMRHWADGPQYWVDPREPVLDPTAPDHFGVYQMNFFFDKSEAFWQEEGTIYWLEFTIQQPVEVGIGWKESADHFNDAAVWRILGEPWNPLLDPVTLQPMDMAFVITIPEPATAVLLAAGVIALLWGRRRTT